MAEQLGAGGLTLEARTFYVMELLSRAVPQIAYGGWGMQKNIPARGGVNLDFRKLERPAVATTALTQGTPPSATAITWTHVTATIGQYGAYARLSDIAITQSIDEQVSELVTMWGEHMGDTLDIICRNELIAGTTVQYAAASTTRGDGGNVSGPLLEAEIREAVATLKKNNVKRIAKAGNRYVAVAHPNAEYDFVGSAAGAGTLSYILSHAAQRGEGNPLFTGDSFDFFGVKIIYTSNARVYGSAGSSGRGVFTTLVMGEQFYGESKLSAEAADIIVKPIGSSGALDALNQFGSVGWKAAYTARRLNESNAVRIEHGATLDIQGGVA